MRRQVERLRHAIKTDIKYSPAIDQNPTRFRTDVRWNKKNIHFQDLLLGHSFQELFTLFLNLKCLMEIPHLSLNQQNENQLNFKGKQRCDKTDSFSEKQVLRVEGKVWYKCNIWDRLTRQSNVFHSNVPRSSIIVVCMFLRVRYLSLIYSEDVFSVNDRGLSVQSKRSPPSKEKRQ